MSRITLYNNDCLVQLKELKDNSVDSIVTNPPDFILYENNENIELYIPSQEIWEQCLRVLKPGGHLLSFSESILYHRMAVRIEDAGFEIRDQIMWIYGNKKQKETNHEPIVMARKPLSEKSIAENVLEHGTGGINIDDSRIQGIKRTPGYKNPGSKYEESGAWNEYYGNSAIQREVDITEGRFPANIILDEEAGKILDEQSGELTIGTLKLTTKPFGGKGIYGNYGSIEKNYESTKGGASRFFYKPKEDEEVLSKPIDLLLYLIRLVTPKGGITLDPFMGFGISGKAAIDANFNFIGIEKEYDYFQIAKQRIKTTENK
jgi:site-specific DNA-methyltransferase (adenine-specific)